MAGPEPYESGWLDVGDDNHVYWECVGDPHGPAAVVVHGGPGSGCTPGNRRAVDPARFRVVLFDQRGCGRSTPHASDPDVDMSVNTTAHLLRDMERLREHLGIDRWLLFGGSWGSTLALAYAQRHPQRVSGVVLVGVTTTTRAEIDWLYRGAGRFFPEQWERFCAFAGDSDDPVAAYARLMEHEDDAVRRLAAREWCAWEDAVLSAEPSGKPNPYGDRPERDRLALVRICTHYFSHAAWLEEGALLRDAHRLVGIPGALIHGRLDLSAPLQTAWRLSRAWPDARLTVVDDAGHKGSVAMASAIRTAVDGLLDGE